MVRQKKIYHQKIPNSWIAREKLRTKGQFWTPDWVADAMVCYSVVDGADHIFDPAVGAGAFFLAAKKISTEINRKLKLVGTEIDPLTLHEARQNGLSDDDLVNVQIRDFVLDPPEDHYKAIVGNPPYIRHHRLSEHVKTELKSFAKNLMGTSLDGRAGYHIYFLIRALQLLDKNGKLAFIMPADTCEGIFSFNLWQWITNYYRLEAVVTFEPGASPFPGVDVNPIIFMIRNANSENQFLWARCRNPRTEHFKRWVISGFKKRSSSAFIVYQRRLSEGLATGLSRTPNESQSKGPLLADYAKVLRGIATGANSYFFLTNQQAIKLGILREFLIPAIGRTRDVSDEKITRETLETLKANGRPTFLLSLDGRPTDEFPKSIRDYIKLGEHNGINKRTLIATRNPWYKMEVRPVPPILFAYLGRRNARFIRNLADVVPLTSFLCVYPTINTRDFVEKLWEVLKHPKTVANLSLVGKSYGAGAIKVEPRALEKLPLPKSVVSQVGLQPPIRKNQPHMF